MNTKYLHHLSAETLEARHCMRPLTALLTKAGIRYKWQAYTKVQVNFKGVPLTAEDFESAAQMLRHLGLEVPEEFAELDPSDDQGQWQKA